MESLGLPATEKPVRHFDPVRVELDEPAIQGPWPSETGLDGELGYRRPGLFGGDDTIGLWVKSLMPLQESSLSYGPQIGLKNGAHDQS